MAANKTKGADLSGLDNFSLSSFLEKGKTPDEVGAVAYAPIELFDEDPENARKEFDARKLKELAASMEQVNPNTGRPRGILEPLSVKHHPEKPGHFLINGGNRRFRAAAMAGIDQVPYVVKDELDDFDKFVLNDQREALSPLEIAMFIKARRAEGYKAGDIAKSLGRPASYVSDHAVFFDMADCIRDLYDAGICRSMQALAVLHRAHKKFPEEVERFARHAHKVEDELTISRVRAFADSLKKPGAKAPAGKDKTPPAAGSQEAAGEDHAAFEPGADGEGHRAPGAAEAPVSPPPTNDAPVAGDAHHKPSRQEPAHVQNAVIQVRHADREARLLPQHRAAYGFAWLRYEDDGDEAEVSLSEVQLVAIIEV